MKQKEIALGGLKAGGVVAAANIPILIVLKLVGYDEYPNDMLSGEVMEFGQFTSMTYGLSWRATGAPSPSDMGCRHRGRPENLPAASSGGWQHEVWPRSCRRTGCSREVVSLFTGLLLLDVSQIRSCCSTRWGRSTGRLVRRSAHPRIRTAVSRP